MKKTLLKSMFVGGLLTLSMGAQAQTDVTSKYLKNADFSASTPITAEKIYGYGKDGSPYSLQDVEEWTTVFVQGDANSAADFPNSGMGGGVVAYGSATLLQGNGKAAPAADPNGQAGNCLGYFAVWGCGGYYAQDVTLPAGEYTITVPIYSQSGTNATTSYTGFFPTGSETGYTVATNPEVGSWAIQTVSFSLTSETAGQIRLGYKSNGSGSAANPMIFIDGIKIEYAAADMLPKAKAELQSEIDAAEALLTNEDYTEGVEDFKAAIDAAKNVLASATTVEEINAAVEALKAAEKAFLAANMFSYQKYILVNTSSKKFWGAANNWGTRASLVEHPEYVMLVPQPDGKYYLESQVSNGGTSYYFNGDYMDNGSPVKLTIKRNKKLGYAGNEEKIPVYDYTIANDGKYYGWDGESTILGKELTASDEKALWVIVSLDEAKAFLSEATAEDPMDATFLIEDHNFGRNNRNHNKWTYKSEKADGGTNFNISGGEDGQGSIGNNCAESFHAKFEISQTLADAPAGDYELTAQGFYREDEVEGESTIDLPVFFANDATATFPVRDGEENSMSAAGTSFLTGKYTIEPIKFTVTEAGKLTIGARLVESTNLWCIFDNFVLWYYGPGETVGITTLKAEKSCDSAIYNLQGQRVEKAAKGIYIQNGKKYLVK